MNITWPAKCVLASFLHWFTHNDVLTSAAELGFSEVVILIAVLTMDFHDWTHSNSVVYSPDDKALMLSIRHQAWVIKINYNDGAADGSILWKLGYQGDFALQSGAFNSVDPVDWFSAQHDANIVSTATAGTLDVLLFDNGNQRILQASPLVLCGSGTPCDSRVPILHLDEAAKTADITWVDKLAPLFSFFGGSARLLKNGNVEFDECAATPLPNNNAQIFEVTKTIPRKLHGKCKSPDSTPIAAIVFRVFIQAFSGSTPRPTASSMPHQERPALRKADFDCIFAPIILCHWNPHNWFSGYRKMGTAVYASGLLMSPALGF